MRNRVQVQGPQEAQALQTVARPGVQSAGAPRIGVSKGAMLAEALSGLEPALKGHLQERQQEYEIEQAERAYDTMQGMTFDDAKALVDSGQLRQTENPWYEAAFQKQFGVAYAGQRRRQITQEYENSFDKHNGDIEQFISQRVQADAQQYGQNKFVAAGIREGMGSFLDNLRDTHSQFRSDTIQATTVDQFRGAAATVIDTAIASQQDPSTAVRSLYEQHRTTFGLSYQQMDDNIIALAEQYAEAGDAATVEALLNTPIVGADGQNVGAFTSRARYASDAQRIINQATAKRGDLDRQFNTGEVVGLRTRAGNGQLDDDDKGMIEAMRRDGLISQDMAESLLVQDTNSRARAVNASYDGMQESSYRTHVANELMAGRGFGVTDFTYTSPDGTTHTLKRDAVVDAVVTETLTGMANNGYTENEMAATLASWGVGSTFQVWENALTDGYMAMNSALAQAGPDGQVQLPPAALAGYGTWRNLSEHPNLRARHVKDAKALQIYRDAEALERGGMEPETALTVASRIDRNNSRNGLSTQLDRNTFTDAVRSATNPRGWSGQIDNAGWASSTIEETARILMDNGLPMNRAIEQSVQMFEDSHTFINNVAVNTRNKLIPPDFGEMSEIMIDQFAQQHDVDPDDLTIVPTLNGEQNWVIAYKNTMLPHEEWVNGGGFNINDIQDRYSSAQTAEAELAREQANSEIARQAPFLGAKEAFEQLPRRHRTNIQNLESTSDAYRRMQDAFGKEIYPDGGVPFYSLDRRGG